MNGFGILADLQFSKCFCSFDLFEIMCGQSMMEQRSTGKTKSSVVFPAVSGLYNPIRLEYS